MAYTTPVDIAKRACQHCGQLPITAFDNISRQATEVNAAYDNIRLSELGANTWAFSHRRVRVRPITSTSQIWTPPDFVLGDTYTVGAVVMAASSTYANGVSYPWILQVATDVNNAPDLTPNWSHYWGNLMVDVWDSGIDYAAGEVALLPPAWLIGTTYNENDLVIDSGGDMWVSLQDTNLGNTPSSSPTFWVAWVFPSSGQQDTMPPPVITFTGTPTIYLSLLNGNGPTLFNPAPLPSASTYWNSVGGTVQQLTLLWPTNSGPWQDTSTLNVFKLPFGWLRPAVSQSNKNSAHPWLGALYGEASKDYVYQGQYFTAGQAGPVDLDFIADIADVTEMHPLFCEVLAASLARGIDTAVTEGKHQQLIERAYKDNVKRAKDVDAIVQAMHTQYLDELIRVRF